MFICGRCSAVSNRSKSDEIFWLFDVNSDGFLDYKEAAHLAEETGDTLPKERYPELCSLLNCAQSTGLTAEALYEGYTVHGQGNITDDYELFRDAIEAKKAQSLLETNRRLGTVSSCQLPPLKLIRIKYANQNAYLIF